ncbi:molybdenum cofactor guanylyltransferase [Roseiconus nitratireducens]|uniref:Molybdenum cofactor guanylyltransferase n=1 Tax=Roseiconus nitratireducens TaxID=2605748 RepID=A0A5M6D0U6_9BACT|nr:molybdenum cofactor guanylyltransferase [Roseiconus nitratireducens]KAA5541107.1 molybdenum cofactor guanylyltransferase [Roseiconus nitratireducens]
MPDPATADDDFLRHHSLLGVVLCGGRSTRMGTDKAGLKTDDGIAFLDLAYQRLQQVCDHVCLSASADRQTEYPLIADPAVTHGPISGLIATLRYCRRGGFDGCLVTPVDTPRLSVDDLRRLTDQFDALRSRITCAVSPDDGERLQPLIAVYPTRALPLLERCVADQKYGLQRLLMTQPIIRVPLSAAACHNVNEPSDL